MGYPQVFAVSAAGMDIESLRVDVAAMNLANADVALGATGDGYRPMRVLVQPSAVAGGFATQFDRWMQAPMLALQPQASATRQVLDPGNPFADAKGMVSYPAIDTTTEMMTLMSAMRAYEANVVAMNIGRSMAMKALEIGGQ